MTLQAKKNIDLLVPLVVAAAVGLFYFQKTNRKSWQMLLALLLITFAVCYGITSKVTKGIYEKAPPTPLPNDVGLTQCSSFNPQPITEAIKEDAYRPWYKVGVRDVESYQKLAALSNCELVKCFNFWNANYFNLERESLVVAVDGESAFIDPNFGSVKNVLAQKFAALNLK